MLSGRSYFILSVIGLPLVASAQLRVVSFNTSNSSSSTSGPRAGMDSILAAIGSKISDDPTTPGDTGISKPIDVLCLQESNGPTTTGAAYAALMNSLYSTNTYTFANIGGASTGSGTQVMVYNSAAVQYIDGAAIGTATTAGQPRQTLRYRLRPVGYGSNADFYIYNGHWKSSNDSTSRNRRLTEANAIRADSDALPAGSNIVYLGDMNVYNSDEVAYQRLLQPGVGQAVDPINMPGSWSGNATFKAIHTQSPYDPSLSSETGFNGTSGGVDDRFDQQLVTSNLMDGNGVAYIPNSYFAFGNNGTHQMNQPIDSGSGASDDVLRSLSGIIDHLPVVADYQLPARMNVTTTAVPARVIAGAVVNIGVNVRNSAPTAYANGADQLTYNVAGAGAASGSASGSAIVTQTANAHAIALNTSTAGVKSGTISVNATSEATADASFNQQISTTVVAPAGPSFSTSFNQTSVSVDFGIVAASSNPAARVGRAISIVNRPVVAGFTSALDIDSLSGVLASSFELTGTMTGNIPADGVARNLQLALKSASGVGTYNSALTLNTSDENIPGETQHALSLLVTARIALAGDATLNDRVDLADFTTLAANFGETGNWQDGDFTGDGLIDLTDFTDLASNFGLSAVSFRAAVPEPGAALIGLALLPLIRRRKK